MKCNNIRNKVEKLLSLLNKGLYEREEVIALSFLSAMAGESIFLLGLPGVGKSMVARRLKLAFKNAKAFEYLMSRFSTPDEIFGPVSISKLKDEDRYERATKGYLPESDVVFLDEIWKAGPAIQNSLLTVLNEKIYKNGEIEMKLPLKGIIAASNELPAEDEGLEALWDRFIIRYVVGPVQDDLKFLELILSTEKSDISVPEEYKFSEEEYALCLTSKNAVTIPQDVCSILSHLHIVLSQLKDENDRNIYISDRRWKKIVNILRTSAFLNGRNEVDFSDCFLIRHMVFSQDMNDSLCNEINHSIKLILEKDFNRQLKETAYESSGKLCLDEENRLLLSRNNSSYCISLDNFQKLQENEYNVSIDGNEIIIDNEGSIVAKMDRYGILLDGKLYGLQKQNDYETVNSFLKIIKSKFDSFNEKIRQVLENNIFITDKDLHNEFINSLHTITNYVK